jgi:hypothetical protein
VNRRRARARPHSLSVADRTFVRRSIEFNQHTEKNCEECKGGRSKFHAHTGSAGERKDGLFPVALLPVHGTAGRSHQAPDRCET